MSLLLCAASFPLLELLVGRTSPLLILCVADFKVRKVQTGRVGRGYVGTLNLRVNASAVNGAEVSS